MEASDDAEESSIRPLPPVAGVHLPEILLGEVIATGMEQSSAKDSHTAPVAGVHLPETLLGEVIATGMEQSSAKDSHTALEHFADSVNAIRDQYQGAAKTALMKRIFHNLLSVLKREGGMEAGKQETKALKARVAEMKTQNSAEIKELKAKVARMKKVAKKRPRGGNIGSKGGRQWNVAFPWPNDKKIAKTLVPVARKQTTVPSHISQVFAL